MKGFADMGFDHFYGNIQCGSNLRILLVFKSAEHEYALALGRKVFDDRRDLGRKLVEKKSFPGIERSDVLQSDLEIRLVPFFTQFPLDIIIRAESNRFKKISPVRGVDHVIGLISPETAKNFRNDILCNLTTIH